MKSYFFDKESHKKELLLKKVPCDFKINKNEVLVKIESVSLNYRDLMILNNSETLIGNNTIIPLSDASAEVIEIGENVKDLKQGEKVIPAFYQKWQGGTFRDSYTESALGIGFNDGVLSEFRVFPREALVKSPRDYTNEEISTLPCAALTAWHSLFNFPGSSLFPGEKIVTLGTGGVSLFAIQFALAFGLEVIAITSSELKIPKLKSLGVKHIINSKKQQNWSEAVMEITNGLGVERVIETVGSSLSQSIASLAMGGSISVIGALGGNDKVISPYDLLSKSIHLYGVRVGSIDMLMNMVKFLETKKIRPVIDKVFGFSEANNALNYFSTAEHFGKVVINVSEA